MRNLEAATVNLQLLCCLAAIQLVTNSQLANKISPKAKTAASESALGRISKGTGEEKSLQSSQQPRSSVSRTRGFDSNQDAPLLWPCFTRTRREKAKEEEGRLRCLWPEYRIIGAHLHKRPVESFRIARVSLCLNSLID